MCAVVGTATQRNMRDDVGGSEFLLLSGFLLGGLFLRLLLAAAFCTAARIVWGAIENCAWEHHHYFSFAELMHLPGASPDLRELLAMCLNVRPFEIALIRFSAPLLL